MGGSIGPKRKLATYFNISELLLAIRPRVAEMVEKIIIQII